jgi:ribosomal protein S18 acetylase RimI-like enzyme
MGQPIAQDGSAVSGRHRFYSKATLEEWITSPGPDLLLVSLRGSEVMGLLFCRIHRPRTAVLENIAVSDGVRNEGLASELFSVCCQELERRNVKSVTGIVRVGNPAMEFFRRLGFRPGNQFTWIEKDDLMTLNLEQ